MGRAAKGNAGQRKALQDSTKQRGAGQKALIAKNRAASGKAGHSKASRAVLGNGGRAEAQANLYDLVIFALRVSAPKKFSFGHVQLFGQIVLYF